MLTPIDIQNHTLKTSMSGYNKKDTEEFLASILDSYETLFRENRTLKEKITSLSEGIQYYKQMENTLQKALILAEKTSTETQEAAKEQADSIVKDAQAKADTIIKDIKAEADAMKAEKEVSVREAEIKASAVTREAEEKAALIISDAERQALEIKSRAQDELDNIRINAIRLVQDYDHYCHQVKKLAKAQLGLLESDEYKLHVTELNISDSGNNYIEDNTEKDSTKKEEEVLEGGVLAIPDEINQDSGSGQAEEVQDKTDTENSGNREKFSWNSDGSEYSATKEPETPFTFIDPE